MPTRGRPPKHKDADADEPIHHTHVAKPVPLTEANTCANCGSTDVRPDEHHFAYYCSACGYRHQHPATKKKEE